MLTKKQKIVVILYISILLINIPISLKAQDSTALKIITNKKIESIHQRADEYNDKIDKQTAKYLNKIQKQEQKLQKKLSKIDSTAAKQLFEESIANYKKLDEKLKNASSKIKNNKLTQYIAGLDSASTSLQFLGENIPLLTNVKDAKNKIENAINSYETLKNKLEVTKDINQYIVERKELIKETFQKYNLGKYLKKYNKTAYYYAAQINEYKDALKDPVKAEKLVLQMLNKIPSFTSFLRRFGFVGNDLNGSSTNNNIANMVGLQSRIQTQQYLVQQFGGNQATIQRLQQNLQAGQQYLKPQNSLSNSTQNLDAKDFRPNEMKTKDFSKRLEKGFSLNKENTRNGLIPNLANLGASVGYKLRKGIVVGLGINYKTGIKTNGFKNIKITNEAFGLRSFLDINLTKNGFWLSGGYEQNYMIQFKKIDELKSINCWQRSFLFGATKKIAIKNKTVKMQLLYDVLSNKNVPNFSPLIYRITFIK